MEKRLAGSLARFGVPDILLFLHAARCTGVLLLERPGQETKVFYRHGSPVFATSNREEHSLAGDVARLTGRPVEEVESLLVRGRRDRLPEGQIMVDQGIVTSADLAARSTALMLEALYDTFAWREGDFSYWDGVEPPAVACALPVDLHGLIMEGARRVDARARLTDVFPDHGVIVDPRIIPESRDEAPTLAPNEWRVYRLADGRRSLVEICRCNEGSAEEQTLETVHRLLLAGYVALRQPEVAAVHAPETEALPALAATRRLEVPEPPRSLAGKGQPRLVVIGGARKAAYPITKSALILGRHRNCDVVLADAKVSSSHARVECTADAITLVDLESRNGSYVNGRRVTRVALEAGDEIQLGTTRIVLRVDGTAGLS